ncbi:MAG: hypothetical protein FWC36_09850 [Spirochaetes bacterium]|nr:hypothetical protein [Spirochaetota bacterium]
MKKGFKLFGFFAFVTFIAFLFTGCATAAPGRQVVNEGEFSRQVIIPAKDFESRGLVFTEIEYRVTSRAGRSGETTGEAFTYQALLREAQRLGADAIINVTIDRIITKSAERGVTTTVHRYLGTALAIRYTTALRNTITTTTVPGGTVTTTSDQFIVNNDSSPKQRATPQANARERRNRR